MKNRSDTTFVITEIMEAAAKEILPPACVKLTKGEMEFFNHITAARFEWTSIDLVHAANLARCLDAVERNQKELAREGDIIMNARETPIMNPRFTVLEQLTRRSISISSKIQVHAAATIGESKLGKNKNTVKRKAAETLDEMDDDLIQRPN